MHIFMIKLTYNKNGVVAVNYELLWPFKTVTNYWAKKVTAARQSLDGYFL